MSTTSLEIVRWKYHARELQTAAILNEAENGIDVEVAANAEQFKRLDALLCTSPVFLDLVINDFRVLKLFHNVRKFESTAGIDPTLRKWVFSVLIRLARACEGEVSGTREITIDSVDLTTPLPIKQIFKDKGEVLEQTIAEGHEEAAKKLLTLTQGEIPHKDRGHCSQLPLHSFQDRYICRSSGHKLRSLKACFVFTSRYKKAGF